MHDQPMKSRTLILCVVMLYLNGCVSNGRTQDEAPRTVKNENIKEEIHDGDVITYQAWYLGPAETVCVREIKDNTLITEWGEKLPIEEMGDVEVLPGTCWQHKTVAQKAGQVAIYIVAIPLIITYAVLEQVVNQCGESHFSDCKLPY